MSLTQQEYESSRLIVESFSRVDALSRQVTFKVVYDGESRIFTEVVRAKKQQPKDFYIDKAFRKLRKSIREWVKSESATGGVVGRQYVYQLENWNADDADADESDA